MLSIQQLALAHMTKEDLAICHVASVSRPQRAAALGIDWYQPDHRHKPLDRMRFVVARFEWQGTCWRRVYKYGGPRPLNEIQAALESQAKRLGLPIIDQA